VRLELQQSDFEFIIKVIASLPTESGAYPLFATLVEQYKEQLPKPIEAEEANTTY
jgi:hypothetical protein